MINILVVEDSGATRLQIKQMLKGYSCNIYEASAGMQVVMDMFSGCVSLLDIHLVLLDIYLGEIDGYQVLAHLRGNYPHIPVIMMSVDGKQDVILKSIKTGAKDFLLKPFTKELLVAKISKFCDIQYGSHDDQTETDSFIKSLILEIERAIRSKTGFIILTLEVSLPVSEQMRVLLKQLKKDMQNRLRKIDSVFIYNHKFVLILPYTKESGLRTVKERIYSLFEKRGISFVSQVKDKNFIFPDDVADELIKTFKIAAIKDLVLHTLL